MKTLGFSKKKFLSEIHKNRITYNKPHNKVNTQAKGIAKEMFVNLSSTALLIEIKHITYIHKLKKQIMRQLLRQILIQLDFSFQKINIFLVIFKNTQKHD